MTLTLELPPEIKAQIEQAAAEAHTDVLSFIITAATEKAARAFDEQKFNALLELDPMAALDYVLDHTPDRRSAAHLPPLTDEQVSRAAYYED